MKALIRLAIDSSLDLAWDINVVLNADYQMDTVVKERLTRDNTPKP